MGDEGPRPPPVGLTWSRVDVSVASTKGTGAPRKAVLRGAAGAAQPSRLTALLGPSGSGKTTLLSVLAGQLAYQKGCELRGVVQLSGEGDVGAVAQEEQMFAQMTVRETLSTAAALRLPQGLSDAERGVVVDRILAKLSLVKCAETPVGDAKTRGISGGERKRLSLGCELISSPSLLCLDEPTSGLDSFQAEKVMATLKGLAAEGHTVVASIHQPSGAIWRLFDDVVLLSEGLTVYAGSASGAVAFVKEHGFECPSHLNPAEFLLDLISVDFSTPEAEASTRTRVERLAAAFASGNAVTTDLLQRGRSPGAGALRRPVASFARQFRLLFVRSWRQITRDKKTNAIRANTALSSALMFGSFFWKLGFTQAAVQSRLGLLQVAAINTAMTSVTKTLSAFSKERQIVQRERAKGQYDVLPYFASKLVAELPVSAAFPLLFGSVVYPLCGLNRKRGRFARFLAVNTLESFASSSFGLTVSSLAPSTDAAMALGPALMVVFIVFGGAYVAPSTIPKPLRFMPKISLIKYGFEALAVNEMMGLKFEATRQGDAATGEQALARVAFEDSTVAGATLGLAKVLLVNYALTFYILNKRAARYQPLLPPKG